MLVVRGKMNGTRESVVKMREGDLVLDSDLLADGKIGGIAELVPIPVECLDVSIKRLKIRTTGGCNLESGRGEDRFFVEEIRHIGVGVIREEGTSNSIQVGHDRKIKRPKLVSLSEGRQGIDQFLVAIEPPINGAILLFIKVELGHFQWLDVETVFAAVRGSSLSSIGGEHIRKKYCRYHFPQWIPRRIKLR